MEKLEEPSIKIGIRRENILPVISTSPTLESNDLEYHVLLEKFGNRNTSCYLLKKCGATETTSNWTRYGYVNFGTRFHGNCFNHFHKRKK